MLAVYCTRVLHYRAFFSTTEELLQCSVTEKFVINFLGACLCYKLKTTLPEMNILRNLQTVERKKERKKKKENKVKLSLCLTN
jgi:hypothetical protein